MKKLLLLFVTIFCSVKMNANIITVTNTNQSGPGSLFYSVANAIDKDTITFVLPYPNTIFVDSSGEFYISKKITILGPGAGNLAIDGAGLQKIFTVAADSVTISDLTIQNGYFYQYAGGISILPNARLTLNNCVVKGNKSQTGEGGGISNNQGNVILNNCIISGNTTNLKPGGGINSVGGSLTLSACFVTNNSSNFTAGIYCITGDILITNSTISGNISVNEVGGINLINATATINDCMITQNTGTTGGIELSGTVLTIENSTVSSNTGNAYSGGIYNADASSLTLKKCKVLNNFNNGNLFGGGIGNASSLTIEESTIAGNTSSGNGGGILSFDAYLSISKSTISGNNALNSLGGGVYFKKGSFVLENSTISGNSAATGGAIYLVGKNPITMLTMTNCTVANNNTGESGTSDGLFLDASDKEVNFSTVNSIFANTNRNITLLGTSYFTSYGYNISSDSTMLSFLKQTGDMNNTDPKLNALANNGGPTETHSLKCESPAINAGTSINTPTMDQIGTSRVGNTDIGAYEFKFASTNPTYSTTNLSKCASLYTWNNNTYNVSGSYTVTIPNAAGCDSIMTLNLILNTPPVLTTTLNNFTITADEANATYQWINCSNNQAINGETNQSFTATANGSYAVVVNNGLCSDTSNCVQVVVTDINSQLKDSNADVKIWPNPSNGEFNLSSKEDILSIEIYDVFGKKIDVIQKKNNLNVVDLSKEAKGIYYIAINTTKGRLYKKVIVN